MSSPEERSSRPNLRLTLVGLIVLGLFALLGLRLWSLQVVNYKAYAAAVNGNTLRIASVTAPRGDIVDRNDTVIVGNVTQQEIVLSRAEATQHPESIGQVAALVGETPKQVKTDIANPQYSPYEPVPVLDNAPAATVQYLEAHQDQYPGVSVQSVTVRSYPQGGTTANQVLGYVSPITGQELAYLQKVDPSAGYTESSQIGQTGLESEYESYLKGTDGKQYLEVNSQGNVVGTLKTVEPTQGDTLVTNLDLGLQQDVEQALANDINADRQATDATTHQHPEATNGAAIVMDVNTGAVLAMASYPNTNDLNNWVGGISEANYKALEAPCQTTNANAGCPLINYAIQGRYTPGSTFKLNTATAALQDGLITPDTLISDPGSFTIPDCTGQCTFNDADDPGGTNSSINVSTALTESSDVFFYTLGYDFWQQRATYGDTAIQDVAAQYSLGQLTGIDLPNEVAGQVDSQALDDKLYEEAPQDYDKVTWTSGYNLEMAFGQGATVITPIEQAVAYSTFANGGTRYQPLLGAAVVTQRRQGGQDHPAQGGRPRHHLARQLRGDAQGVRGRDQRPERYGLRHLPGRCQPGRARHEPRRQDGHGGRADGGAQRLVRLLRTEPQPQVRRPGGGRPGRLRRPGGRPGGGPDLELPGRQPARPGADPDRDQAAHDHRAGDQPGPHPGHHHDVGPLRRCRLGGAPF